MRFSQAIQNTHPEDRAEYITALVAYKEEGKLFHKARKLYKDSPHPLEQLKWYKARDRYSLASKLFQQARDKFSRAQTLKKLEARDIDAQELAISTLASMEIPTSLKDMLEETRRERLVQEMPSKDLEELIRVNKALMNKTPLSEVIESDKPYRFGAGDSSTTEELKDTPDTEIDTDKPIEFDEFDKL
jgi:hypothetical protein